MKGVVMFSVVVNILSHKQTFLARVVLLPLVMYFYVFLHDAVFITPKSAPGTNTVQVLLFNPGRKILQKFQAVANVAVAASVVFTLFVFLEASLVIGLVVTRVALPELLLFMNGLYVTQEMILSGHFHATVRTVVGLHLIVTGFHVFLVTLRVGRDMTALRANIILPGFYARLTRLKLRIIRVSLVIQGVFSLVLVWLLLLLCRDLPRVTHLEVSQQGGAAGKLQFTTLVWAEEDCGQGDVLPTVLQYGGSRQSRHGGFGGDRPAISILNQLIAQRILSNDPTWCQCGSISRQPADPEPHSPPQS